MGMTIDKSTEVLADYIDTYKVCGGNGYNPATNITQEACETFEMAVDTMRKYQKISEIVKQKDYDRFNSHNYYGYFLRVQDIRKVLEDGSEEDGNNN